jgi:hypothetical protein
MMMRFCTKVQALFAGGVGVSPLQNVLVDDSSEVGLFCVSIWVDCLKQL